MNDLITFRFALTDGWSPTIDVRDRATVQMRAVLAADDLIEWDMSGMNGAPPRLTITAQPSPRTSLEVLALVVQALNSAFIYVDGWPNQSCVPTRTGGFNEPPVAIGTVTLDGFWAA